MTEPDDTTADSTLERVPWRRIANVVGLLLLIAIALPFLVHAVPQVVGAEHSYVVTSGSMEPAMSPGDVIVVNSVAAENIEEGDVITYGASGDGLPTTHRVVDIRQQDGSLAFQTKGDANEDPDGSLVTPDEIQGRVMSPGGYLFVIPYIGYVIDFAGTPLGFAALFGVPIGLLVLLEARDFVASTRSDGDSDTGGAETGQSDAPVSEGSDAKAEGTGTAGIAGNETTDAADVESGEAESSEEGITFSAAELQLGLSVLAVFLAYSVWVAYQTTEVWAFGVMGGVGAAVLLVGWLYFFGGGGSDAETGESGASGTPSESGSPASAASEALDPSGGNGTRVHATDIDPEVEVELLKHIIRRTDGGDPSARIEELVSDDVSAPKDGEVPPEAGSEYPGQDQDDEGRRDDDRTPQTDGSANAGEHDE